VPISQNVTKSIASATDLLPESPLLHESHLPANTCQLQETAISYGDHCSGILWVDEGSPDPKTNGAVDTLCCCCCCCLASEQASDGGSMNNRTVSCVLGAARLCRSTQIFTVLMSFQLCCCSIEVEAYPRCSFIQLRAAAARSQNMHQIDSVCGWYWVFVD
jgi:hypothetical protein